VVAALQEIDAAAAAQQSPVVGWIA
jgi:hypothetical protein